MIGFVVNGLARMIGFMDYELMGLGYSLVLIHLAKMNGLIVNGLISDSVNG